MGDRARFGRDLRRRETHARRGRGRPRTSKKKVKKEKAPKKGFNIFDEEDRPRGDEEDLPKDEAGRRKIKRQYEDLLGIRIEKLRGRILNRERINKTIEGIYFICAECKKVCHNVDDGLIEDPDNVQNLCGPCAPKKGDNGKESKGGRRGLTCCDPPSGCRSGGGLVSERSFAMPAEAAKPVPAEGGTTATRILDAAESLFAQRGFAGVSVREIAGQVGSEPGQHLQSLPEQAGALRGGARAWLPADPRPARRGRARSARP